MEEFDPEKALRYQERILQEVRDMERILDHEVIDYYARDEIRSEEGARRNLRAIHKYLKEAYQRLDRMLLEIETRM